MIIKDIVGKFGIRDIYEGKDMGLFTVATIEKGRWVLYKEKHKIKHLTRVVIYDNNLEPALIWSYKELKKHLLQGEINPYRDEFFNKNRVIYIFYDYILEDIDINADVIKQAKCEIISGRGRLKGSKALFYYLFIILPNFLQDNDDLFDYATASFFINGTTLKFKE